MDTAEAEGELRDALARLLRERCDIEQVRGIAAAPGGWDRQLWSELAAMGVVGLAAPAEHGGEGAGRGRGWRCWPSPRRNWAAGWRRCRCCPARSRRPRCSPSWTGSHRVRPPRPRCCRRSPRARRRRPSRSDAPSTVGRHWRRCAPSRRPGAGS
ncbi:acyl-CoA dehydrogenase family protein [Candidatus Frankia alpina]|uniref:acyl-CoA dehydrogenase family protein n=1 Tax=Candidatus Frankia alpina TaxID=2699483 RepID=UPI00301352EB